MAPSQLEISELRVYPIKSCRGVKVNETTLTKQGLNLDRRWMFVSAGTREFLTIRQNPRMTLIKTVLSDDGESLQISVPKSSENMPQTADDYHTITVPVSPPKSWLDSNTKQIEVIIWGSPTSAYQYTSPDILNAVEKFFGSPVFLVQKSPDSPRICGGNGAPEILGREASVNFPDVLPVLIASEASLKELNSRLRSDDPKLSKNHPLDEDITIERFRPNIIVRSVGEENIEPWSEDTWKLVRLQPSSSTGQQNYGGMAGGILFTVSSYLPTSLTKPTDALDIDVVARCARCQVPNVQPETAEKHAKQPWDTLMSYRRVDPGIKYKPCFGMLSVPRDEGAVSVGMKFEVLEEMGAGKWKGMEHKYQVGF